jgi:hypothetical protein
MLPVSSPPEGVCRCSAALCEVALASIARHEAGTAPGIEEEVLALGHVLHIDLRTAVCLGENAVHKNLSATGGRSHNNGKGV